MCVNDMLIAQSCAPGLVWSAERSQCDFPSAVSCTDRRQVMSAAMTDGKPDSLLVEHDEVPRKSACCYKLRYIAYLLNVSSKILSELNQSCLLATFANHAIFSLYLEI